MLRLADVLLSVAPLLAGALLFGIVFHRLPSRRAVLVIVLAEAVVAGLLIWQSSADSLRPHQAYVPAKLHDGNLVEGHGG